MPEQPEQVLSEFIDAWNAGQRPRVREYLSRVPEAQRDALADEIGTWLEIAPSPELADDAWEAVRAEPAVQSLVAAYDLQPEPLGGLLASLRAERGLERGQLAERLAEALGVQAEAGRVEAYVAQIERGSLDARGLSQRVLGTLAGLLDVARSRLEAAADAFVPAPVAPAAAPLLRASSEEDERTADHLRVAAAAMSVPAPEPWDEVDRLFRGGR